MKKLVLAVILSFAIAAPANAQTVQQQRMKDCNSQASGADLTFVALGAVL